MPVQFFYLQKSVPLRQRNKLKSFIEVIFREEKIKFHALTCIFCSDNYLLQINKEFLQHNFYTDIITFDMSDNTHTNKVEGEIYISVERVKENAKGLSVTYSKELHRVIFHGVLHLCGYGDKTAAEIKKMRLKEDFYLNLYF